MASYYYHSFSFSFFLWWTIRLMIQVHSLHLHHNSRHYSHCRGVQQQQHKHNAVIGDCDCDDVNANNNTTNDTNDTKKNSNSCRIKEPSLYVRCPDYPSFAYYGKGKGVTRRVSLIDAAKRKEDNDTVDEGLVSSSTTTTAPEQLFGKVSSLSSSSMRSSPSFIESDFNFFRAKAKKRRLLDRRSYASSVPFEKENRYEPPTLDDLKPPPFPFIESIWISTPYRIATFALAYFLFPYVTGFLNSYTTMEPDLLSEIVSKFGPGVSVLYGTFISLTLSILYGRQKDIQNDVAVESSLLALITRNLLNIFRCDRALSIEVGQSCADQIRILVKGSRGTELLAIMYSDPYARMLEIIDDREYYLRTEKRRDIDGDLGGESVPLGSCRQILEDLYKIRADRLSDESLALPPTHFFIMTVLTGFILLGYAINVLPTVDVAIRGGRPSNESALIFGLLTTVYVIFYNFAQDLNNPFSGLYQIRRSSTAAHLLQAKWLLVNNPFTRDEIDFDEPSSLSSSSSSEDVLIKTPGIGEMLFSRDEIYPDDVTPPPPPAAADAATTFNSSN